MGFTTIFDKIVLKYDKEPYVSIVQYEYFFDRGMQQPGHVVGQFEGGIVLTLLEDYYRLTPYTGELGEFFLSEVIPGTILFNPGFHIYLSLRITPKDVIFTGILMKNGPPVP